MIRVLVAEDSRAAQDLLVALLEAERDIEVVGRAGDGGEAVEMAARLRPDLITMDIHMPGMDGFEATRQLMAHTPTPIILVSSLARREDVELSLRATRLGAVMVLPKPPAPGTAAADEAAHELRRMVRALSQVKVVRRWAPAAPDAPARTASRARSALRVAAVAASTGGPAALQQLLTGLRGFGPPVLVVQHIARGFGKPLADWLNGVVPARVKLAEAGERPEPGTVYLAADDRHLRLAADGTLRLDADDPVGGFRPSATALFESVGRVHGASAAVVVLTGMGSDGVPGVAVARAAGAFVIAQDEASSVVWGMPRAAVEAGLADEVLPLASIAPRLLALAAG